MLHSACSALRSGRRRRGGSFAFRAGLTQDRGSTCGSGDSPISTLQSDHRTLNEADRTEMLLSSRMFGFTLQETDSAQTTLRKMHARTPDNWSSPSWGPHQQEHVLHITKKKKIDAQVSCNNTVPANTCASFYVYEKNKS